jgi:hypothetical protein
VVGGAGDGGGEAEEGGSYDGEQCCGVRWARIARDAMRAHAGLIIIFTGLVVKLCGCGRERRDDGDGAV